MSIDDPSQDDPTALYGTEVLCEACARVFCPEGERLHFHHDGCPACDGPGAAGVDREVPDGGHGEGTEPQLAALRAAARALVSQLDLVLPTIQNLFVLNQIRSGVSYQGPTIARELATLRALLTDPPIVTPPA
jgi:hypothetical protein